MRPKAAIERMMLPRQGGESGLRTGTSDAVLQYLFISQSTLPEQNSCRPMVNPAEIHMGK